MKYKQLMTKAGYSQMEVAKILGEPKDPRKPVTDLVAKTCEVDFALPTDHVFYYDVLLETDIIYVVTSTGAITQQNVTADSDVELTFVDIQTPEYFVKLIDLAKAKESVLKRKLKTINRSLNAEENYRVVSAIDTAIQSGNAVTLRSGETKFVYPDLIDMIDNVEDYGSKFVLICSSTIAKDIRLWDYDENKYHSLKDALNIAGHEALVLVTGSSFVAACARIAWFENADPSIELRTGG